MSDFSRSTPVVHADFLNDLRLQLHDFLRRAGYSLPSTWPRRKGSPPQPFDASSPAEAAYLYFNVRHRRIARATRTVHESRHFRSAEAAYSAQTQLLALLVVDPPEAIPAPAA